MMKYSSIIFLLISLTSFAQQTDVFKIDSLPEKGIVLNKNWKFLAGDNPDFTKPDFDDSKWESIDPTKDIFDLPQVSKKGDIFWLRIPLLLSDSTSKEALIMSIQQSGASEIFLNGKLLQRIGVLSKDKNQIKALLPVREPFSLPLPPNQVQMLAVRYAFQPNVLYGTHFGNTNKILQIELNTLKTWHKKDNKVQLATNWNSVVGAVLITLFILYFAFYLFFSEQKTNLYFTIYTALNAIPMLGNVSDFYTTMYIKNIYWFFNAVLIMAVIASLFLLLAVYRLFNQKIGTIFWLIFSLGIICVPMAFFVYSWGWVVFGVGFNFLINFELLRIAIIGVLKNKKGAWFIASGGLVFCASWVLFLFGGSASSSFEFAAPYFYALAQISIPLSIALNLGYNFAQTNLSLQQKLSEVEKLSGEKKQILATQNETLEQQVTERTTALNQSLENLKQTQTQLIQSEKLASLGELTAGIAHEIQNSLNFVNNFSELSVDLATDINNEIDKPEISR